tara:strand:- start:31 stop:606 length:576 start_codon:yes stop_codon:yes gene_type:complete
MVNLSRIYTKTGDRGQTRLGDNSQVAKTDLRIEAYGTVDELNAVLGLARASAGAAQGEVLQLVQNDLFDLGADLCQPLGEVEEEGAVLRIQAGQVVRLEAEIDRINADLEPLRSFVLPGGATTAAWLHLGRTVCRRAERCVWALAQRDPLNEQTLIYLNRLSDLLFVMGRAANDMGRSDVLWEPGKTRGRE